MEIHPWSAAWVQWIESPGGRKCNAGTVEGQYLYNRLWAAFMAGAEAGEGTPRIVADSKEVIQRRKRSRAMQKVARERR